MLAKRDWELLADWVSARQRQALRNNKEVGSVLSQLDENNPPIIMPKWSTVVYLQTDKFFFAGGASLAITLGVLIWPLALLSRALKITSSSFQVLWAISALVFLCAAFAGMTALFTWLIDRYSLRVAKEMEVFFNLEEM